MGSEIGLALGQTVVTNGPDSESGFGLRVIKQNLSLMMFILQMLCCSWLLGKWWANNVIDILPIFDITCTLIVSWLAPHDLSFAVSLCGIGCVSVTVICFVL